MERLDSGPNLFIQGGKYPTTEEYLCLLLVHFKNQTFNIVKIDSDKLILE